MSYKVPIAFTVPRDISEGALKPPDPNCVVNFHFPFRMEKKPFNE
jgi:hypothetical protein